MAIEYLKICTLACISDEIRYFFKSQMTDIFILSFDCSNPFTREILL